MPRNNEVTHFAVTINTAIRKAVGTVHKSAKAGLSTEKISRQVAALKRQLRSNTEGQT
jgi:hypothetical protein